MVVGRIGTSTSLTRYVCFSDQSKQDTKGGQSVEIIGFDSFEISELHKVMDMTFLGLRVGRMIFAAPPLRALLFHL